VSARFGLSTTRCQHKFGVRANWSQHELVSARVGVSTTRCQHELVSARQRQHHPVSARLGVRTNWRQPERVSARLGVSTTRFQTGGVWDLNPLRKTGLQLRVPSVPYDICCNRAVPPRDDVQYRYLISLITQYLVDVTSHLARNTVFAARLCPR
jgi:hypothetical protein